MGISFSEHNRDFYNKSDVKWLETLAKIKGLDRHQDMESIRPFISKFVGETQKKVMEIGAGFGRVSQWFQENFPQVDYTGIDFCKPGIEYCKQHIKRSQNCHFILGDLLQSEFDRNYDLVLWPWSGFLEVSNDDKLVALKTIHRSLMKNGLLLLDFPKEIKSAEKLVYKDGGVVEQHAPFGYAQNQLIDLDTLEAFCQVTGFEKIDSQDYLSNNGFLRFFVILKKKE